MSSGLNVAISFDFSTAPRIIFGLGKIGDVGSLLQSYGKKVYVLSGVPDGSTLEKLLTVLSRSNMEWRVDYVKDEPSITNFSGYLSRLMAFCPHAVVGFGGGSAMDTAKALAALATNPGEIIDYLEIIGRGKHLTVAPLPIIAIPTTAGTGSEVTRNAVIVDNEHRLKVSLRSSLMIPSVALVDPELTLEMPPHVTASTGMDAITQLIEPLTSNKANPLTDAVCREGLKLAARSIKDAYHDGSNLSARQDMAFGSLMSGIALANAKLGVVHGFASVLGGMFPAPHGAVCARLLPYAVEVNIKALRKREPSNDALRKYVEIARIVTGSQKAMLEDGVDWLRSISNEIQIKPLREYGLLPQDFSEIVQRTVTASSTQGNPLKLADDELFGILEQAY